MRVCEKCHGNFSCEIKHAKAAVHCGPPCGVCNGPRTEIECFAPVAREIDAWNRACQHFILLMRARFIENLDKGGWQEIPWGFALRKLCEEVGELGEVLTAPVKGYLELPLIKNEATDVGNFACMIAMRAAQEQAQNEGLAKLADQAVERAQGKA